MAHQLLKRLPVRVGLLGLLGLAVGGCAAVEPGARQLLDERTGASWVLAEEPLVLARERRDLAVQARDYLTLLAVEANESGRRRLLLVVHQWSTIDARTRGGLGGVGPLLLVADGRDLLLNPAADSGSRTLTEAARFGRPEDAEVVTTLYPIDADTLRYLATSQTLRAALPQGQPPLPYALWRDGRPALLRLLTAID